MSTPIPEGLGKCGICLRTVHQTDAISSVLRGYPPRAYICHKDCKDALEAKNGPEPQLTQTDYMKLAPEEPAPVQERPEWTSFEREDLHTALKEDFGEFIATAVTGTGEPIPSERQGTAEPATEADEAALQQAYGKSSEELAEEAEKGYDVAHLPVGDDLEAKPEVAVETPSSEPTTDKGIPFIPGDSKVALPKISTPIKKATPAKKAAAKKASASKAKVTVTPPDGVTQIVPQTGTGTTEETGDEAG